MLSLVRGATFTGFFYFLTPRLLPRYFSPGRESAEPSSDSETECLGWSPYRKQCPLCPEWRCTFDQQPSRLKCERIKADSCRVSIVCDWNHVYSLLCNVYTMYKNTKMHVWKAFTYTLSTFPSVLQTWKHKAHQNSCYQWIYVVAFVNDSDCDAVKK